MALISELYVWMKARENGRLEFKEAKNTFDITKLTQYCSAFANEGGGRIVLGVTDQLPRKNQIPSHFQVISQNRS